MAGAPIAPRWVPLDGAVNVRDLGGLPVPGGSTRPGVLLRADNLQGLSARDVACLVDDLGVRVVVDLRTASEVELEGPGPLVADGRVDIRHRSLYPEAGERTDVDVDADPLLAGRRGASREEATESAAVQAYLGYLRRRPDSVVGALRDVAHADGATVIHCAAGKDRTGTVCALALEAAGVPRDVVVADYAATGDRLPQILARLRSSPTYAGDLDPDDDDVHRPHPEIIARFLEVVDERHGGAAAWLEEHGFGEPDRAALRRRLVG